MYVNVIQAIAAHDRALLVGILITPGLRQDCARLVLGWGRGWVGWARAGVGLGRGWAVNAGWLARLARGMNLCTYSPPTHTQTYF